MQLPDGWIVRVDQDNRMRQDTRGVRKWRYTVQHNGDKDTVSAYRYQSQDTAMAAGIKEVQTRACQTPETTVD